MKDHWYTIKNENEIDSPALLIYKDRVQQNIAQMVGMSGNAERLVIHVKTNKMPEVVKMLLAAGITKFKCATIAEAEMVAIAGGKYIVIAHQLAGPKVQRLIDLRKKYPDVFFASLVDCTRMVDFHNEAFAAHNMVGDVFVDINNGMNRSGHPFDQGLVDFYAYLQKQPHLKCHGLHVYDGHIRDADFEERKSKIEAGFEQVEHLVKKMEEQGLGKPMVIAGGTPSFTTHILNKELYSSPGTCVLWDWGYGDTLSEQPFEYAALLFTRVISKPSEGLVTLDLGHKAVAAENPIDKRVQFFNAPEEYELLSQSEEHGVLRVSEKSWKDIQVGDVFYGVPYHICPTVNLYDHVQVVAQGKVAEVWEVLGRKRKITV